MSAAKRTTKLQTKAYEVRRLRTLLKRAQPLVENYERLLKLGRAFYVDRSGTYEAQLAGEMRRAIGREKENNEW